MTRLRLLILIAVAGLVAWGFLPTPAVHASPLPQSGATAPYHYFGPDSITVCQQPPPGYTCSNDGAWWKVTAHVAGWDNDASVVLATGSGYPYCSASGYEISVTSCSYHYSGATAYVVIGWSNCFGLGPLSYCWSDSATMGFDRFGRYVYYHEAWSDAYP